MDHEDAGRTLSLGLLDLVGPAAVVSQNLPFEEGRITQPRRVHQDHHDLSLDVQPLVVVPAVLRRDDSVAGEDQVTGDAYERVVLHRPEHVVLLEREGRVALTDDGRLRTWRKRDDRYLVVVGPAVAGRLEAQALELRGDVLAGDEPAPCPRRPPLERVVGEEREVRPHHAGRNGVREAGARGLLGVRWCHEGADGQEQSNEGPEKAGQGTPPG